MSSCILMKFLCEKKGSVSIKNGHETATAWFPYHSWIKRSCRGRTTKKLWWTMKNTRRPRNPNADLGAGRWTLTTTDLLRRSPPFSGPIQVDAAAKVDGDRGEARRRRSSSSGRVVRGRRRRREKNEKDRGVPIYKGISEQAGAKIEEDPNNDYPTKRTPRFSKGIKDEDPLRDDVIKVFRIFKRWRHGGLQKLLRG